MVLGAGELVIDHRFGYDFATQAEVEQAVAMVADAMAVATGWSCHGNGQTRLNVHGPNA